MTFYHADRRRRQVGEEFTPAFFDELNVTADVAMACEGNPACIFDLIQTGDMEVAMNALNHDKETNATIDTISKSVVQS